MLTVLTDAACVRHYVGDIILLVDPMQQVGHGSFREHGHVLSSVSLHAQWYSCLGLVVVVLWTQMKGSNEKLNTQLQLKERESVFNCFLDRFIPFLGSHGGCPGISPLLPEHREASTR